MFAHSELKSIEKFVRKHKSEERESFHFAGPLVDCVAVSNSLRVLPFRI